VICTPVGEIPSVLASGVNTCFFFSSPGLGRAPFSHFAFGSPGLGMAGRLLHDICRKLNLISSSTRTCRFQP
jgi:hypothetical protein